MFYPLLLVLVGAITASFYAHIHTTSYVLLEDLGHDLDALSAATTELNVFVSNMKTLTATIEALRLETIKLKVNAKDDKRSMHGANVMAVNQLNMTVAKATARHSAMARALAEAVGKANGCLQQLQKAGAVVGKPANLTERVRLYAEGVVKCRAQLKKLTSGSKSIVWSK